MGIRNAGDIIREARLKAGLTQEELSDGICTLSSLCNIENGKMGVCPSTFKALMSKAGVPCETYPIFRNRDDFDAFIYIKNIRLYLDNWCLSNAQNEFIKLQSINYGNNRLNYQEALFLYALMLYKSYSADNNYLLKVLEKGLMINHPDFNFDNLSSIYLNQVEIEILFLFANININCGKMEKAKKICDFFSNKVFSKSIKDKANAYYSLLCNYIYAKIFFITKKYSCAKQHIDFARDLSIRENIATYKIEILLLQFLLSSILKEKDMTQEIQYLLSTAIHLECGFIPKFLNQLQEFNIIVSFEKNIDVSPKQFQYFSFDESWESMSDGVFDIYEKDVLTIGSLIGELRKEQRLSLSELCSGLCSLSKLSKIERREQEPSVYLAEALLNRLGYSERIFTFYGNKKESTYSQIKNKLIASHKKGESNLSDLDELLKDKSNIKNPSIIQLESLFSIDSSLSVSDQLNKLTDALKKTIPDFEISKITSYRLTWAEITLLNNIIIENIFIGNIENAFEISKKLVEYGNLSFTNINFYDISLSASFILNLRCYYRLSMYNNIIALSNERVNAYLGKSLNNSGNLYFYFSQALGEIGKITDMIWYAQISVGYFLLFDNETMATYLKNSIKNDFQVDL